MSIWKKLQEITQKPEYFFALVAAIFGSLFILITPPFQGPDEQAHFAQVYRYSEGSSSATGGIPASLGDTYQTVLFEDDIRFNGNEKYELTRTKHALLELPLNQNDRDEGAAYSGTGYSPLPYIIQIVLVFIGHIFDAPIIVLLYLARIGTLMTFLILLFVAIKYSPVAKWPLVVIGLLPMSIFSGSMVSTDALTIGSVALFVAFILKAYVSRRAISNNSLLILTVLIVALVLSKIINIILLPLLILLLFKKNVINEKKRLSLIIGLMIVAGLIIAVGWQLIAPQLPEGTGTNIPKNVDAAEQIKLIIESPQKFFYALWNTYYYAWGDGIFYSLIGTFGWVDTSMALPIVIMGYVVLVLALLSNREQDSIILGKLRAIPLTGLWLVFAAYFLGVNAAMFIYYSPVDFNIIVGLQGRYFIPVLILLALITINKNVIRLKDSAYRFITVIMPVLLLIISTSYIFIRYYVNTRI